MSTFAPTFFKKTLAVGLADGGSETTLSVSSWATKDGYTLTMADIGDIGYLIINPGASNMEIVSFTGISGSTATGLTRGINFYNSSTTAANKKSHSAGEVVIFSDNFHWWANQYVDVDNTQTV